jgi:hypothetical protein
MVRKLIPLISKNYRLPDVENPLPRHVPYFGETFSKICWVQFYKNGTNGSEGSDGINHQISQDIPCGDKPDSLISASPG